MKKISEITKKYAERSEKRKQEEISWLNQNEKPKITKFSKFGNPIHDFKVARNSDGFYWEEISVECPQTTKQNQYLSNLGNSGIPKRFANAEADMSFNYKSNNGIGVLITGGVGTGKTHKLVEIIKGYIASGVFVKFQTFGEISRKIKKSIGDNNYNKVYKEFADAKVLVIDDIGTENNSEFMKEFIYNLINDRYNNMKPILITTNLNSKELAELYSQRVVSRLTQMCKTIKLEGKDWRAK